MARTPVTPEDAERGQRMRALRNALGLTQEQVLGPLKRPQIVEAENGRDRLRGQLLFHYADATGLPVDKLRSYALGEGVSLEELVGARQGRRVAPGAGIPVRTTELDTQRDRLWVKEMLLEAGFSQGIASDVALTMEMIGARSPEETKRRAKELASLVRADSKGKLITSPQPPHPKKPPKVGR